MEGEFAPLDLDLRVVVVMPHDRLFVAPFKIDLDPHYKLLRGFTLEKSALPPPMA